MAKTIHDNFEVYTIASADGRTRASFIPAKGGVGSSIVMSDQRGERELLYLHDYFWQEASDLPGGWPFCFPICARLERMGIAGNYLYEGKIYNLPIHGFSWWLPWEVISHTEDSLSMRLTDTERTLSMYPFKFELILNYQVSHNQLSCHQTYTNNSIQPMPYYAGFHPYFLTPPLGYGKELVTIDYQPTRRFLYNQQYTDLLGEQDLFEIPIAITEPEINEQLTQVGANKLIYLNFPDRFTLALQANGTEDKNLFSYIQLYHIADKPFFCVEPWMSFPNAMNSIQGVRWLGPKQSEHGILTLQGIFNN